eukprot:scaffold842_cov227-Pinguiococcus_pyrenoidosus.AAC.11
MAGEHPSGHDEVRTAAKRLGEVAGASAAAVADDVAVEPVSGVGALDDGAQLWVPHAGLEAGGADGARADAHLDDVGAGEEQLFHHLAGDDVASDDPDLGMDLANSSHVVDEVLRVAVGHVDAEHLDLGARIQHHIGLLEVRVGGAQTARDEVHHALIRHLVAEGTELLHGVVLVQASEQPHRRQRLRHLEGARRVHVRHHDGNPCGRGQVRLSTLAGSELHLFSISPSWTVSFSRCGKFLTSIPLPA